MLEGKECKLCSRKVKFGRYGSYSSTDNEITIATGAWTTLEAGLDPRGNLYLSAMGDGRADYYPKFCPECGKKIAEGTE